MTKFKVGDKVKGSMGVRGTITQVFKPGELAWYRGDDQMYGWTPPNGVQTVLAEKDIVRYNSAVANANPFRVGDSAVCNGFTEERNRVVAAAERAAKTVDPGAEVTQNGGRIMVKTKDCKDMAKHKEALRKVESAVKGAGWSVRKWDGTSVKSVAAGDQIGTDGWIEAPAANSTDPVVANALKYAALNDDVGPEKVCNGRMLTDPQRLDFARGRNGNAAEKGGCVYQQVSYYMSVGVKPGNDWTTNLERESKGFADENADFLALAKKEPGNKDIYTKAAAVVKKWSEAAKGLVPKVKEYSRNWRDDNDGNHLGVNAALVDMDGNPIDRHNYYMVQSGPNRGARIYGVETAYGNVYGYDETRGVKIRVDPKTLVCDNSVAKNAQFKIHDKVKTEGHYGVPGETGEIVSVRENDILIDFGKHGISRVPTAFVKKVSNSVVASNAWFVQDEEVLYRGRPAVVRSILPGGHYLVEVGGQRINVKGNELSAPWTNSKACNAANGYKRQEKITKDYSIAPDPNHKGRWICLAGHWNPIQYLPSRGDAIAWCKWNQADVDFDRKKSAGNSVAENAYSASTPLKKIDYDLENWFPCMDLGDLVAEYKKNRCVKLADERADTAARDALYDALFKLTGIKNKWARNSVAANVYPMATAKQCREMGVGNGCGGDEGKCTTCAFGCVKNHRAVCNRGYDPKITNGQCRFWKGDTMSNALRKAENMSTQQAISAVEMLIGTGDPGDQDEALSILSHHRYDIERAVGRRQYEDMYRRASNAR